MFDRSQEFKASLAVQSYRVCQEGLPRLLPLISRQRLYMPVALLLSLMHTRMAALPKDPGYYHPDERDTVSTINSVEGSNATVGVGVWRCIGW